MDVNKRLKAIITSIINNSSGSVIIVLQSDHGPAKDLDWNLPSQTGLNNRAGILNAYYLSDECDDQLFPPITPVNPFRFIFNCEYGTDLPLLPDETFYRYDKYIPIENAIDN